MRWLSLALGAAVALFERDYGDRQAPALIRRALSGNKGALRILARRLLPVIHARVRRWLGRRGGQAIGGQDADDLVQEVWLTLLRNNGAHLRKYDPERRASLESYVLLVADRELGNQARAARRKKRGGDQQAVPLEDTPAAGDGDPEQSAVSRDLLLRLDAHLRAQLPPRAYLIFRYLYTDGLKPARVAEILGVSTQVVYNWQHKVRTLSRAFLTAG